MKRLLTIAAAIGGVALLSVTARGAVVLKNADWATDTFPTNGMGAAHGQFPSGVKDFTVEAWVKPSKNVKSNGTYGNWIYANMGGGNGRYIFLIYGGRLCSFHASPRGWYEAAGDGGVIPVGTWTHVAMARTSTSIKFYVNGQFVSETNAVNGGSFLAAPTGGSQTIGNQHSGLNNTENANNDRVFQGRLSDVRVWTTERTAEEIAANYAKRLRGNEENLFTYVPFSDAHDGLARNWADGLNLVVPPQYRLVEDAEIDAKFTERPRLPPLAPARAFHSNWGDHGHAVTADVRLTGVQFTVEAWLRPTSRRDAPIYWMGQYESGHAGWLGFAFAHNSLRPALFIGNSSANRAYAAAEDVPLHEWTHVAIVRDHGTVAVYTNGLLSATRTVNSANAEAAAPDAPLTLAVAAPQYNGAYGGDMRDVRVWNTARTADEIADNFDKRLVGKEAGLLGYWPMDEGYGTNVYNKVTGAAAAMDANFSWSPDRYLRVRTTTANTGIATHARLTAGDFTLEAWVRVPSPTPQSRGYIIGQWANGYNPSWVTLCFDWHGSLEPALRIGSNGATTNATHVFSAGAIRTNEWNHVAATREGSTVKMYLNGKLTRTGSYACDDPLPPANISLLALNNSLRLNGDVRELRAWNLARTGEEIAEAMNRTLVGNEEGLAGYWPCCETADAGCVYDWVSSASHAYVEGVSSASDSAPALAPSREGRTLMPSFDGAWSDVMRTGVGIDVQDFTFETWVYPTAYPSGQWLGRESFLFSQWKNGGDAHRFLIGFNQMNHFGVFLGGNDEDGNAGGWRLSASETPLNTWTHLAATREGATLRLYVNGVLDSTFENFSTISPWSESAQLKLTLGGTDNAYPGDYSRMLHGSMREARVWNRACSAEEIAANCRSRLYGTEAGLVGYWPLDETGGTVLTNALVRGGAPGPDGFMISGWDYVEPLALADPPKGLSVIIR